MKLLIWGAGAIGGTIGAHLARAGHPVTLVDRAAEHVGAINRAGLEVSGPVARFTASMPAFTPDEVAGRFETVLLATKAQDTADAARAILPYLSPDGYVVSAQNGLNELTLAEIVGPERTVGAFVNFGADYIEPGLIHYAGRGAFVLGELDGKITPRLEALRQTLLNFDDGVAITSNIWGYLWGKEAYGAMLFATALTDESIADAFAAPEYRDLYIALAGEVLSIAQARGVTPEAFNGFDPLAFAPGADPAASARSLDELVAFNRRSAKTHSGVWRDLAVRKRRTEVDDQIGIIAAIGAQSDVPTPLIARLVELIHDIEDGRRPQSLTTLDLLKARMTPL
ncbi:MAG: ketopantoate reductase family protein [Desulfobacteraceae bacterium]|nr:MAG: ketopantoate reductase family protein [Desulfobacteraceae bacterium]